MEPTPYSFADAEEICEDFEDMKDTEFVLSGVSYIVDDVIVCPFEPAEKQAFFTAYAAGDKNIIVAPTTDVARYDVTLVVSDLSADEGPSFMSVQQYVAEKGVNYNFPTT